MEVRVFGIFKFGQREHIQQFRREGLLYCNNVSFFRDLEGDVFRRDKREGINASYLAADVGITIGEGSKAIALNYATGLRGRVDVHLGGIGPNIFCMYALTERSFPYKIDPRNFFAGDTIAVILDADRFRERIVDAALRQGLGLRAQLVEYVNEETYSGDLGPFRKLSSFSHQSEYRIALYPGVAEPREFRIGTLMDITTEWELADINNRLKYEVMNFGSNDDSID